MWLDHIAAAAARIPHSPRTARIRAVTLTGKRGALFGRTPVHARRWRQPREEKEAALLLAGLANTIIAATGYTSTKEAGTSERSTEIQSIGSMANRVFD
jgi:hypothetical protein